MGQQEQYPGPGGQCCHRCGRKLVGSGRRTLCASCQEHADPHKYDFREDDLRKDDRSRQGSRTGTADAGEDSGPTDMPGAFNCDACGARTLHDHVGTISRAHNGTVYTLGQWECRTCGGRTAADSADLTLTVFEGRPAVERQRDCDFRPRAGALQPTVSPDTLLPADSE